MPTWIGFKKYKLLSIMTGLDVVFTVYLLFGKEDEVSFVTWVFRPYLRVHATDFPVASYE